MRERAGAVVQSIATGAPDPDALNGAPNGALKSLAGESVADRYCAWRGASGQRYVASIFPVVPAAADGGLPAFDGFVLIAVARTDVARRILFANAVERASEARCAVARGLAEGAAEWHVHFLAERPSARAEVVADLGRRHLGWQIGAKSAAGAFVPHLRLAS